jgi:hypothetical protein
MVKGFNLGLEAENKETPTNKVLLNGREFKVSRSSFFVVPVEAAEIVAPAGTLVINSITFISGDQYSLAYSFSGNLGDVLYRYRLDGTIPFTAGFDIGLASPFNITLPTTPGTYNVQIYAYDNDNAINVYSNIFNTIVT